MSRLGCGESPKRSSAPSPARDPGSDQDDTPAWKRAKSLGLAIVNFAIALSAARFAMGSGQQSSQQNAGLSAQLMQSGWGKALLIAVALGLVGVGGYHVYKGASKKFLKDLRVSGGTGITAVGVTGYVAKGLVLAGAGVLVDRRDAAGGSVEGVGHRCGGQGSRATPRSASSCSSWPHSVSPRSAHTASCAHASDACDVRSAAASVQSRDIGTVQPSRVRRPRWPSLR